MTKPKIIQSLLAQVSKELNTLTTQRNETENEIIKLNQEINRLNNMPVCREDFGVLLKESLEEYGKNSELKLIKSLIHEREQGAISPAILPANKRSFNELDDCFKWLLHGFNFEYNPFSQSQFKDDGIDLMVWLFPDRIHEKVMAAIDKHLGTKWGNDDLPRLAERREKIADLTAELAEQQTKLDEINAAIAEISRLTVENS